MVLISMSKQELQEALNDHHDWTLENDFTVNKKKTVSMAFRKGRKLVQTDFNCCNGKRLKNINSLQSQCDPADKWQILQATREGEGICCPHAVHDIENLTELSLETAMELSVAKITSILMYGLEQIWEHLTVNDIMTLENVKAMYQKRAFFLSRFTASQLAYTTASEPLVEKLRN
jgi:hypothetical protein